MKTIKQKRIKIFNNIYTIKYVDKIKSDEDKFLFGITNVIDKHIYIATKNDNNKKLSNVEIKTTLYHELIHAILSEGAYEKESDNEPLVEWIAKCLVQLNTNNII